MDWAINIAWAMNAYQVCRICHCVDVNAERCIQFVWCAHFCVHLLVCCVCHLEWVCNCIIVMWMHFFFSNFDFIQTKMVRVCGVWLCGWMGGCKRYNTIYNNNVIIIPVQRAQSSLSFLHFIFVSRWINK